MGRYVLERSTRTVKTEYGEVRIKEAAGMGVKRFKAEYDDVAELARRNSVSTQQIRKAVDSAAKEEKP